MKKLRLMPGMVSMLMMLFVFACSSTSEVPDSQCAERCINATPDPDSKQIFFCACRCRNERNTGDKKIREAMCRAYEKGMRDRGFIPEDSI